MRASRLVRENMRPDTAAALAWRLADRKARDELRPEFDRALDEAQKAGDVKACLEALAKFEEAREARVAEILSKK